jgi:tetratricopeptide (TPR) repeat protein
LFNQNANKQQSKEYMNVTEFTSLINNPNVISDIQNVNLEKIVQEFPYFQSARALYLKGLYNQNSFKYNYALKIAAAHTTDRSVLFDFITSDSFATIQNGSANENATETQNIPTLECETIDDEDKKLEQKANTIEESIQSSIKTANPILEIENQETEIETPIVEVKITSEEISNELELGKPLEFSVSEKHSFQEWLQLSVIKPIVREEISLEQKKSSEANFAKQKKKELIDKFIETSPKIPPIRQETEIPSVFYEPSNADNSYLMTETLARVYLEQKKYQRAIQAYQILILKYPEKSSFFADRILDIKNLQQNNK